MAHPTLNEFADWCYNRYVEAELNDKFAIARFAESVLRQHLAVTLKPAKFRQEASHAKKMIREIDIYKKDMCSNKLEYAGSESVQKKLEAEEERRKLYQSMGIDYPFTNKK